MSPPQGLADVAEWHQHDDVLSAGAAVDLESGEQQVLSPTKPKRWDQILRRPDLDYGDLFSEETGKLPGISLWQIENFYPVEVEESELLAHGCTCDLLLKFDFIFYFSFPWTIIHGGLLHHPEGQFS